MDDIEDLVDSVSVVDFTDEGKHSHRSAAVSMQRSAKFQSCNTNAPGECSNLPGVQKVWLHTFGCSHNVSDGEYMKGCLLDYGYELTEEKESAEVWVINSCTVKDPSQANFMRLVTSGKESGKGVVVAGCVPQADRTLKGLEDVSMIGVTQIDKIVSVVEETAKGNSVKLLAKSKNLPRLDLPKVRKNRLVEIVPLSTGCLGSCTYCKTKHARGKLGSYQTSALVDRVETVLAEGQVREIWLASEDTGAYGRDINTNIAELFKKLCASVETHGNERTMLKLGMTNPPYMMDHLEQIAETLQHKNVFNYLHIPVQSGSNQVLERMKREYTVQEFTRICDYLIKYSPGITIATDIICGFPGETDEQFEETIALVTKYKFPILNISKFYARPGTPAAKMKRVDTQTAKARSTRLSALFESYKCYDKFVGTTVDVWFTIEIGKSKDGIEQTVGHTKEYVKVVVERNDSLIGNKGSVRITSAAKYHIVGTLVAANQQETR